MVGDAFGIIAPVAGFTDPQAKVTWEREYPDVLRAYYSAVAAVATCERCGFGRSEVGGVPFVDASGQGVSSAVGLLGGTGDRGCGGSPVAGSVPDASVPFVGLGSGCHAASSSFDHVEERNRVGDSVPVSGGADKSCDVEFSGGCGNDDGERRGSFVNCSEDKPRGKWYFSNKRKKDRREKNRKMQGSWRSDSSGADHSGAFWNSTDAGVRQELVDSKARMHIAENKRRERKALDEIAYLDSPEAAMRKAISMIDYAEKQAKKENDNKVYGWAKTVATSSAESLARSTPDSVPSFDALSKKLEASSQSSFELELKAKQDELNLERTKYADERAKFVDELSLERAKHAAVVARVVELEKEKRNVNVKKNVPRKNFSDFMVDRARERERVIMSFHDEI